MALLENLQWRHATKAYDPTKKVSKEDLTSILEAARLAPTSSGLQPFRIIVVEDQQVKDQLAQGALNPECIRECSQVLVFAAWKSYTPEKIDRVYDQTTDERDLPRGRFSSYTDKLKEIFAAQSPENHFYHASKQAYIALGLALAQAAELHIDSTPAEGFDNTVFDDVLQLEEKGLKSVVIMYIGYSDETRDWLKPMKKVRVPLQDFVTYI